jgi:hypothetical protein
MSVTSIVDYCNKKAANLTGVEALPFFELIPKSTNYEYFHSTTMEKTQNNADGRDDCPTFATASLASTIHGAETSDILRGGTERIRNPYKHSVDKVANLTAVPCAIYGLPWNIPTSCIAVIERGSPNLRVDVKFMPAHPPRYHPTEHVR